ncbi:hypothetical protein [Mucisphaera calidilacus]|uniref:Uncharacterized protein n=1 Tax=Mucisphaera calidilacus TaxID=2527982 RepID=A0A518BVF8_9BACT|nr:hypothetical protein [Mucisphaera calidilacus]QDU70924.1 hypothetical protein Pan265_07680 [Mucisphaera calidilacus]
MISWSTAELADVLFEGLKRQAAADDLEQAVYGFDAKDELGLHPILATILEHAGFGVHREQRYPGRWDERKRSRGERCDLVLTRDGLPLKDEQVVNTLFDQQPGAEADEAYWLEVKYVAQHETTGPFRGYSSELLNPVRKDLIKLWNDSRIRHAGLCLILCTERREIAEHDLGVWHERCMAKGLPASVPSTRGLPITNRIGNGWCSVAVVGVRG